MDGVRSLDYWTALGRTRISFVVLSVVGFLAVGVAFFVLYNSRDNADAGNY